MYIDAVPRLTPWADICRPSGFLSKSAFSPPEFSKNVETPGPRLRGLVDDRPAVLRRVRAAAAAEAVRGLPAPGRVSVTGPVTVFSFSPFTGFPHEAAGQAEGRERPRLPIAAPTRRKTAGLRRDQAAATDLRASPRSDFNGFPGNLQHLHFCAAHPPCTEPDWKQIEKGPIWYNRYCSYLYG